jgi:hydrogenase maturation protease
MKNVLVIGFGNTLRCDDGAGVKVAHLVSERYPDIDCIATQELKPEHAETISGYLKLIFVDASTESTELVCEPVSVGSIANDKFSHSLSPRALISLSHDLYGKQPEHVYLVKIPGENFGFGEEFSPRTSQFVFECVDYISKLFEAERSRS